MELMSRALLPHARVFSTYAPCMVFEAWRGAERFAEVTPNE